MKNEVLNNFNAMFMIHGKLKGLTPLGKMLEDPLS